MSKEAYKDIYTMRRAELTREQSAMVRKMLDSQMGAYKNWIASAVESEDYERAHRLVTELRDHEAMCKIFPPDDMWDRNKFPA